MIFPRPVIFRMRDRLNWKRLCRLESHSGSRIGLVLILKRKTADWIAPIEDVSGSHPLQTVAGDSSLEGVNSYRSECEMSRATTLLQRCCKWSALISPRREDFSAPSAIGGKDNALCHSCFNRSESTAPMPEVNQLTNSI